MNQTALRNRVVSKLSSRHRWVYLEELAHSLDVEIKSLVRVLSVLHVQEHVQADGKGDHGERDQEADELRAKRALTSADQLLNADGAWPTSSVVMSSVSAIAKVPSMNATARSNSALSRE